MKYDTSTDIGKVRCALLSIGLSEAHCDRAMYNDKRKSGRRIKLDTVPDLIMFNKNARDKFEEQLKKLFGNRFVHCAIIERTEWNSFAIYLNS